MDLKYRTDRQQGATVVALGVALMVLFSMMSPNIHLNDPVVLGLYFVLLFIAIDLYWGTYIVVNESGVYAVDYFFHKTGLKFEQIESIYYHPTWIIGSRARTLSIIGILGGKRKTVKLGTNHFYSLKSLAAIIAEVRKNNPTVKMDGPTQELMNRYRL
jgi:hypothetical protein